MARQSIEPTLRGLHEFLEGPRPGPEEPESHAWACSLNRELVRLHEEITERFREELAGGTLARLARRHPRATPMVERVQRERSRIQRDLREIVAASMRYAAADTPRDPRLRTRTLSLLRSIEAQERAETALIQDLVATDVGTGG